jgi:hypothetical protein
VVVGEGGGEVPKVEGVEVCFLQADDVMFFGECFDVVDDVTVADILSWGGGV